MKKKRTLKGMTLIEIIISMFILTIMAGLLLGIGLNVDETSKSTTGMKDKVSVEAPYAANKRVEYIDAGGGVATIPAESNISISVSFGGASQSIDADVYNTADIYDDSVSERSLVGDKHDNRDLRFIQVATAAPTT